MPGQISCVCIVCFFLSRRAKIRIQIPDLNPRLPAFLPKKTPRKRGALSMVVTSTSRNLSLPLQALGFAPCL